jgi:hypothetical protein
LQIVLEAVSSPISEDPCKQFSKYSLLGRVRRARKGDVYGEKALSEVNFEFGDELLFPFKDWHI